MILPRHTMETSVSYSFIPSDESRTHLSNHFKHSYTICPQLPILDPAGPSSAFQTVALMSFLISEVIASQQHHCGLDTDSALSCSTFPGLRPPSEEDPPLPFCHKFSYL